MEKLTRAQVDEAIAQTALLCRALGWNVEENFLIKEKERMFNLGPEGYARAEKMAGNPFFKDLDI